MIELSEGEVHLWFASPDEWEDPALIASRCDVSDAGEIARMERLRLPEDRRLFMVSRLLVRTALSHYGGRPPEVWRFVTNDYGKPLIDPGTGPSPLKFSLAHTAGLAVVGVSKQSDIGTDVERKDRLVDARGLIRRFFTREEAAALAKLPTARLKNRFFLHWTLKESAIKALGGGLSLSLCSVGFRLSGRRPYRIIFSSAELPDAENLRFAVIEPLPSYVAAVCVICEPTKKLTLQCYRFFPPGKAEPLNFLPVGFSSPHNP